MPHLSCADILLSMAKAYPKLCTIEYTSQEAAAKIGGILALRKLGTDS